MFTRILFVSLLAFALSIKAAPHQKALSHPSFPALPARLDLLQTSIEELGHFLSNGNLTSVDLVEAYLHNIDRNNHQGLKLRAVIQTGPRKQLLTIAKELDDEKRDGLIRGPLHGIPMLIKDNIATDSELGMNTTAGNFALQESKVKQDAEVVRRLRKAGAIIIGKANLAEFSSWKAHGNPDEPGLGKGGTEGWSAVGGQTSSAYIKGGFEAGGNPLGSSSGTAVGISAGFAAAGLGSDTTGSVIYPAARAALFGIRSTTGLVSTDGVVPITADLDAVGPIGFTTRDVALVLDALTHNDGRYLDAAKPTSFRGLRLGVVRQNFLDEADGRMTKSDTCIEDTEASLKSTIEVLRKEGADVVDVDMDMNFADLVDVQLAIQDSLMTMTIEEDLGKYLMDLEESPVRSLKDIVKWNDAHANIEFPPGQCCQQTLIESLVSPGRRSPEYAQAWNTIHTLGRDRGFKYLFDEYDLDALVFSPELGIPMGMVAALGYDGGTAPMGYCENGRPIGILFVTKPNTEEKLISIMATYEEIMPKRRTPKPLTNND